MGQSEYWLIKNGSVYLTGAPDAYRSEYGWTKERLLARRFLKRWQAEAYRRSCWRIVHVRIRPRSERLYLCERIRTATQRLVDAVGAEGPMAGGFSGTAMNLEDAVTKAVDQLEAAWEATGVAEQVRGLTTLADVIATNDRDRKAILADRRLMSLVIERAYEAFDSGGLDDRSMPGVTSLRRAILLYDPDGKKRASGGVW